MTHRSAATIAAILRHAGRAAQLLSHAERPWATATFSGTRETVELCFAGSGAAAQGEAFLDALDRFDWAVPGRIVAEVRCDWVRRRIARRDAMLTCAIELLLVDA